MTALYAIIAVLVAAIGAMGFKLFSQGRENRTLGDQARDWAEKEAELKAQAVEDARRSAQEEAERLVSQATTEAERKAQDAHGRDGEGPDLLATLDELSK